MRSSPGEAVKTAIVESITPEAKAGTYRVQCVEDEDMNLDDDDHVTFTEIEGMEGLNSAGPLPISDVSKGKKHFRLTVPEATAAKLGTYKTGGLITEARQPKVLTYRSLEAFQADPGEVPPRRPRTTQSFESTQVEAAPRLQQLRRWRAPQSHASSSCASAALGGRRVQDGARGDVLR